jgi:lipopolysaccharide/colanic/teichoic acid biosynthesis glycosyltransferase
MHDAVHSMRPKHKSKQSTRATHSQAVGVLDFDSASVVPTQYGCWKHLPARCVALALLVIAIPMLLVLIVLIRLTSRGPAIYRQVRVGMHGRTFTMFKLRTMRQDAESGSGPVWARLHDPRVTPLGSLMRKLHLDETPQLINVIRGDMTLVGPRPERPEFTQVLAYKIPGYMQRHLVRPGITGWAQIHLPPDTDLESVRRKLILDLEYVQLASLGLDIRIFLVTLLRLFGVTYELSSKLLRLRPNPDVWQTRLSSTEDVEG